LHRSYESKKTDQEKQEQKKREQEEKKRERDRRKGEAATTEASTREVGTREDNRVRGRSSSRKHRTKTQDVAGKAILSITHFSELISASSLLQDPTPLA
jgi:hypothetical protein